MASGRAGPSGRIRALVVMGALVVLSGSLALPAPGAGAAEATAAAAAGIGSTVRRLPVPADNLMAFGYQTAISGKTAVVVAIHTLRPVGGGSYQEEQGQAFVFSRNGGKWSPKPVATLLAPQSQGQFGTNVAVSGATIAVADPNASPETVYLYTRGSGGWPSTPTVTLTDPRFANNGLNDDFGESMVLSGSTLLVGSQNVGDNGDGVVYVYSKGSGGWPSTATTTLSDPGGSPNNVTNDGFGEMVAVSGTTIMVGAYGSGGNGEKVVYVYSQQGGGAWATSPAQTLADPHPPGDCFGESGISISGATALVGGGCDHPATGVVYVFQESVTGWSTAPVARFVDPATGSNNYFGTEEAVSGRTAIVGSWGFDSRTGRAYVYRETRRGSWGTTPVAVIPDPTATSQDSFGFTLGLSGRTAIIGSPNGDENHSTFNGGLAFIERV